MPAPTIIAGPAVIQFNSQSYYSEGDVTVAVRRNTFNVSTSHAGVVDTRLADQLVEISFKPVGALDAVAKYLPYAVTAIGTQLINQSSPKAVVVWGKDGVKTTWGSGFISKLPAFTLSATKPAVGDMAITVFGDPTKALTAADAWNAVASASLADTTFDETKLVTPQYKATWGTTFVDIESEDGFTFEVAMAMAVRKVDNYGNVNATLTDLVTTARFKPVGKTLAQIYTAMKLQDTGAILPGQSLTTADDLVISASPYVFTLAKAGIAGSAENYGLSNLRHGELLFVNKKTWTSGTINAPFTVAFS
jgi:hypothetical protein